MYAITKGQKIIQRSDLKDAEYACNRLGNKRMWVDGKFYSDYDFNRKFEIIRLCKHNETGLYGIITGETDTDFGIYWLQGQNITIEYYWNEKSKIQELGKK